MKIYSSCSGSGGGGCGCVGAPCGEGGGGGLTSDQYTLVGDVGDDLSNSDGTVNVDWLVEYNSNPATRIETDYGIATPVAGRSSRNNQNTTGLMSKLSMDLNSESKLTIGLDVRTAEIEHTSRIVSLFGADVYKNTYRGDKTWTDAQKYRGLGDRQEYWTVTTVDWQGMYAQYDYNSGPTTAFAVAGLTTAEYTATDKFGGGVGEEDPMLKADAATGWQVKAGASHNLNDTYQLFGTVGYTQLTPSLDKLINDEAFIMNTDFENEFATFVDFGTRFKSANGQVVGSVGMYYTLWENRDLRVQQTDASGDRSYLSIQGQDQAHSGIEYAISYQPIPVLRFDLRGSETVWENTSDLTFNYIEDLTDPTDVTTVDAYMKGTRIGGAPQSQQSFIVTTFMNRLKASMELERFGNMYAQFKYGDDAADRLYIFNDPDNLYKDIQQKSLDHQVVNFMFEYQLDKVKLNLGVFNALDEEYVLDLEDNGMDGEVKDLKGQPQMKRNYTLGVSYSF